jgi:eukaryotic-like serine/threonine-protein kinase
MSPEQVLGRELDGRSDVFTLTTILTEMLIAEPLFGKGQDLDVLMRIRDVDLSVLESTRRRVPADLRALIERGLARRADDRPDASTFLRMLQEVMQRRGVSSAAPRLSRLLARMDLVEPQPGDLLSAESSLKPNELLALDPGSDDLTEPNLAETARYRVRSESGLLGPVSYSELVELILGGVVDSDSMVSRVGQGFERAANLEELRRFLSTPALQWRAREVSSPTWHGSLQDAPLLPVVYRIAQAQETGMLHLRDGDRQKKLYFVEGRPDYVASTDRSELLGEQLVSTGVCLRMEVDMALAVLHRYDGRLGDALVGLGIMRPMALVRAVQQQVHRRFLEAFRWRSGQWSFVRDARALEETFCIMQDPFELLRDAAFETHPDELESALEPIRERVLLRGAQASMPVAAYRLPAQWSSLIDDVNGQGTLASIAARESSRRGVELEDVYRALYLGLSCELLRAA